MVSLGADRFPVRFGGVELPSPVLVAAGCAGSGADLADWGDLGLLGAVTSPTLRLHHDMDAPPRLRPVPGGLLWEGRGGAVGAESYLGHVLPRWAAIDARVVVSVAGRDAEEVASLCRMVTAAEGTLAVVAIELSLLDAEPGRTGSRLVDDPSVAAGAVRGACEELPPDVPVLVRLEDERHDPATLVRRLVEAGAAGIVVSGSTGATFPGTGEGRLCGPGTLGVTAARVAHLARCMRAGTVPVTPLIAVGGVVDAGSAAWLVGHGACAVEVGSAVLGDPTSPWRIAHELPPLVRTGAHRTANAAAGRLLPAAPRTTTEETS